MCACARRCARRCRADSKGCSSCPQTSTILTAPVTWLHTNVLAWRISALSRLPLHHSLSLSLSLVASLLVPSLSPCFTLLKRWNGSELQLLQPTHSLCNGKHTDQKKNPLSIARQERKRTFCFRSYNKTMATIGDVDISPLSVQFTSFSWSLCEQAASSVESRSSWKQCHTGYVSSSSLTHWFDYPV